MSERRTLTDADVAAIADALETKLESRFYANLGKGVWAIVWKVIIAALLFIAAYGAVKGGVMPPTEVKQ
ncbi:hypothetical protein GV829_04680 [Sphingomonas lacunae]|uniref:Uncharacterized protein n=1 Tax=Sphingomonas lacunae TaxID=2698828 RepID=A0A6M4AXX5_9SPHN|nr:hypothetical protein [Sphingomonas lacunae]QJQ31831.1 hypothetical protein GV829_04680 [Sphingomonas lacunae]